MKKSRKTRRKEMFGLRRTKGRNEKGKFLDGYICSKKRDRIFREHMLGVMKWQSGKVQKGAFDVREFSAYSVTIVMPVTKAT